jgi:hypothetical protein
MRVSFVADLWEHAGEGSWHFVTVPEELSEQLRDAGGERRGFGSLRVRATVGATTWETSVFPSKDGVFVLPVKKPVRRAEGLEAGEPVAVELALRDS